MRTTNRREAEYDSAILELAKRTLREGQQGLLKRTRRAFEIANRFQTTTGQVSRDEEVVRRNILVYL